MPRIKKISLIYLPILLVLFGMFSEGAHAQQAPLKKNVLVLHGLWRIRTWEIPFNSILHNELLADKAVTAGITHVYLGLEDFPDGVYSPKLIEELRHRIEKNPVDLVISVLPGADRFLLSYGQELFPGVPKVFAVPGTREIQTLKKLKNAVIIPSESEKALQTTVERIFSLLPDTRHLLVVCGNSSLDHNYLKIAKRTIASSKRVTKVSYLVGLPLDELGKRVSGLATNTAILFTSYAEDKNGKKEAALDVGLRLSVSANAPVFSFHEVLLGTGMIGGHVTSSESYGKNAVEVALRLLKGEQPEAISPNEQITFDVYDWRALKRWNISEDRLPSGSQVRYKTLTLWETYKVPIIAGIGVICLETILIYALFISLMRSKRRKEALQQSEERYRTLQENVPVGIYRTSHSGKFISVNPAAFKMFGLDAGEDLSSYQVSDFYNDPEKRRDLLSQLKTEGKMTDFEAEFRRKDGSLFWGSLGATQVTDKDGNFIFIDGVVQDITERKRAEEALQKLNEDLEERVKERTAEFKKLSEAVTQSPASVVITDKDGTIEYVNPRFSKVTGYTAKEAVGKNPRVLKSGNLPKAYYKDLWDTILSGSTWRGEFINRKKNGEDFWESASISPIKNDAGEITHFVAVKQDITEKKYMEEQLIQAKRAADEANKAKGDFLANMSHEIRTPMNAVIGMTHLALQTDLNIKQRDYLTKIQSSANSLLGIINDILDFSKIEAGKLDMESVEFNLDHVLDNLANLIAVKAREKKDLEILFAISHRVPRVLVGDPLRLGQVLLNLANNAVKFTDSGEIVVCTKLGKKDEDRVTLKFSVRDTGIGLNEVQIDKLFEAFSQADTSTTRKYGGTGLGLNISKLLVEMMGGQIWVESEPGRGSTFHFTANFGLKKEKAQKRLRASTDLRGKKILVVDDNATSRKILQEILQSFSFEVSSAASGEEGLAELESAPKDHPYDLVIMDWKMPGMDGLEASRRIKNHKELGRIPPIILVTAYGREEIIRQAEELGIEGFLIKPVSASVLFDTILQALGKDVQKVSRIDSQKEDKTQGLAAIHGARLLLVEDNEINQQVAKEILESAGLNVSLANNGQEGVSAVKENNYDAVLMDIQMPVMDGYIATREIRNLKSEIRNVPIIAMTAHAMAGDEDKSLQAGMNGHITKPIDPDQLFAALLKWIEPQEGATADRRPEVTLEKTDLTQQVLAEEELPETLAGFDLQAGLERLRGNKRLYRKLLLDFGANYKGVTGEIRDTLKAKDLKQAHSLLHNLKGSAGNLEATDLLSAAIEMEKLVKGDKKKAPPVKQLNQKLAELEKKLNRALESVQTLGISAEDKFIEPSDEELAAIPAELVQDLPERVRDAVEMGYVSALITFAEELKARSDSCKSLSNRIVQLAEDFDFEGILKLADALDAG